MTSSMSSAFNGGNGRFMANSSTTGAPSLTRMTKFPRPGGTGLITTVALPPASACTTLFARVLNADHCLQASMVTEMLPVVAAGSADDEAALVASLVFIVFVGAGAFFFASVFLAFTGSGIASSIGSSSLAAAGALALAELLRVVRPIVPVPTELLPE
jgi:hypothetical protein